ncbi:uncharacterized protein FA14DRAFT_64929 [Meira miltonrushii]|uniref:Uncharacterized protein n=1 Tax=Meira miltonrushii TaxID=1280837 RepID=A0A316V8C0_9BASI|nr:uncharacterized protein FA14DRAFT_64929 [Meira miltonrushii]PWN33730.1 hypothetical protein FA14DRAFT_64929 [Meira miltonrushii]
MTPCGYFMLIPRRTENQNSKMIMVYKIGPAWILLVLLLSILRVASSSHVLKYHTEGALEVRRRDLADMNNGVSMMRRRGLTQDFPNHGMNSTSSSPTFVTRAFQSVKNGVGAFGRAVSHAGRSLGKQVNRVKSYAKAAANPLNTGSSFTKDAMKQGHFRRKMK